MLLKGLTFIVITYQSTANLTSEMWVLYYCPEKNKLFLLEAGVYLAECYESYHIILNFIGDSSHLLRCESFMEWSINYF